MIIICKELSKLNFKKQKPSFQTRRKNTTDSTLKKTYAQHYSHYAFYPSSQEHPQQTLASSAGDDGEQPRNCITNSSNYSGK